MSGYDELGHPVYSVPVASPMATYPNGTSANESIALRQKYFVLRPRENQSLSLEYTVDKEVYERMDSANNITHHVQFIDSYSSFISNTELRIKIERCRPGYIFEHNVCVCDKKSKSIVRSVALTYINR